MRLLVICEYFLIYIKERARPFKVNFRHFSATRMAQQLEQSNPELVNSLRQGMQNIGGGNTRPENPEDPNQHGKNYNCKCIVVLKWTGHLCLLYTDMWPPFVVLFQ